MKFTHSYLQHSECNAAKLRLYSVYIHPYLQHSHHPNIVTERCLQLELLTNSPTNNDIVTLCPFSLRGQAIARSWLVRLVCLDEVHAASPVTAGLSLSDINLQVASFQDDTDQLKRGRNNHLIYPSANAREGFSYQTHLDQTTKNWYYSTRIIRQSENLKCY